MTTPHKETPRECVEAAIRSLRYGAHPCRSPHADDLEAFVKAGAFDAPQAEPDRKRELNRLLNKFAVACTFGDDNTKRMAVGKELHAFVDGVAAPLIARVAELEADAERWQMASTSRNHGITDWNEHGQRTLYDALATQVIDAAIAAKD